MVEVQRGSAYQQDGAAVVASPFRLLGQYHDEETGLAYTRFRYFDAEAGRWCSPDPLGFWGGKNLQAFDGSPSSDTDPLGLACEDDPNFSYRGVHAEHPALEAAKRGVVEPGSITGTIGPEDHNNGGVSGQSAYTSWSHNPQIAKQHAESRGPGGVVLRVPKGAPKPGDSWSWEWSDDKYGESEVLLHGRREGVDVLDPKDV